MQREAAKKEKDERKALGNSPVFIPFMQGEKCVLLYFLSAHHCINLYFLPFYRL